MSETTIRLPSLRCRMVSKMVDTLSASDARQDRPFFVVDRSCGITIVIGCANGLFRCIAENALGPHSSL